MSRSMIKQQNSGATAHVVLYTPRQSTNLRVLIPVSRANNSNTKKVVIARWSTK